MGVIVNGVADLGCIGAPGVVITAAAPKDPGRVVQINCNAR